jgi:ribose 5-phosphate isomerase RpiB
MSFGDILYIIAMILFVFITFGIVKNYYKSKFDDEGRRIDMLDETNKEEKQD